MICWHPFLATASQHQDQKLPRTAEESHMDEDAKRGQLFQQSKIGLPHSLAVILDARQTRKEHAMDGLVDDARRHRAPIERDSVISQRHGPRYCTDDEVVGV